MKEIFFQILDMSVNASLLVLVVIGVRLVLKKAPKYIHCTLWAMVALRLICPALPESEASLMPSNTPVSSMVHVETQSKPVTNELPLATLPQIPIEQMEEQEPQIQWMDILCVVWLVGVATMAGYGAISYLLLRRRVVPSVQQDGVWLCDDVASPFILGVIRPRIYLPSSLDEDCRKSVLAHEKAHLRRKDHWWKPLGFVLLTIHWFNPIMWLAYILLCRDIEAACDERVVKGMEPEERKRYSEALLECAMPRRSIAACPLAFGEQGIKGRIKSVLNYKKPTVWIILAAVVASGVLAVCLLTNPPGNQDGNEILYAVPASSKKVLATSLDDLKDKAPELFELNAENGFEIFVWEEQKYIWCGIMEHTDDPKTQEEVDALAAVSMRNMEMILRQYRATETKLHIIGRFESLEESGGEALPKEAIEMWLKDHWRLGWFNMRGSEVLKFFDYTGPGSRTYRATGETVDKNQLGLLLAEDVVTPTCVFEENMVRPKYDVYTIRGKDAAYLAAGLVCEDMVFEVYKLEKPADSSATIEVSNMMLLSVDEVYGAENQAGGYFLGHDFDGTWYRVEWSGAMEVYHGTGVWVLFDQEPLPIQESESDGRAVEYLIKAVNIKGYQSLDDVSKRYYYDAIDADIDGDGVVERCLLGPGPTSGMITYDLTIWDGNKCEYGVTFYTDLRNVAFAREDEKLVIVGQRDSYQKQSYSTEICRLEFGYVDGELIVTENGKKLALMPKWSVRYDNDSEYLYLSGVFHGWNAYRYYRSDRKISEYTIDQPLAEFNTSTEMEGIVWTVYSVKECPDFSVVLLISGTNSKMVYEMEGKM